jgi:hypothetical protein
MADPVNISLATTLSVIQHLESEINKLDKEIVKIMKGIPQTLTSVKASDSCTRRASWRRSAALIVLPNHADLAKYADLVWSQHQSTQVMICVCVLEQLFLVLL